MQFPEHDNSNTLPTIILFTPLMRNVPEYCHRAYGRYNQLHEEICFLLRSCLAGCAEQGVEVREFERDGQRERCSVRESVCMRMIDWDIERKRKKRNDFCISVLKFSVQIFTGISPPHIKRPMTVTEKLPSLLAFFSITFPY